MWKTDRTSDYIGGTNKCGCRDRALPPPSGMAARPPVNAPMAFLSDVHGNLAALDAVASELRRRDVGLVFVAGDLLLGGDEPAEVFKRLQQLNAACVRGISDTAMIRVDPKSLRPADIEQQERALVFSSTLRAVGELALKFLEKLPERLRIPLIDGTEIVMVHGAPGDPSAEMSHFMSDDELRTLLDDDPADIVVCGATHVPFQRTVDAVRVVNVGSVGAAPEGRVAHFTIIDPRIDGSVIEQTAIAY